MGLLEETQTILNEYESELSDARARWAELEDFYHNKQFTQADIEEMKAFGVVPTPINIVRPFMNYRRAVLTSTKPSLAVVPLQGASKEVAAAMQQFITGKWNSDYLDTQLNLALKDMFNCAVGWMFVDLASFLDNRVFDLNVSYINWRYVFPDPNASEIDLSDAENIFVRRRISPSRAQVVYQLSDDELAEAVTPLTYGSARQVEVIDRFTKFPVSKYVIEPSEGEHLHGLPQVFFTHELDKKLKEEQEALFAEMKALESEGKIKIESLRELHIRRVIVVGNLVKYVGLINIRDYPLVPFINEHGPCFKDHQAEVEFIKGIQKAVNKYYVLTLYDAMTTLNQRFTYDENAIKDPTIFQKTAHIPGAGIPYLGNPSLPDGGRPQPIQKGTLGNGFFGLRQDLFDIARFETSTYGPQLGDPSQAPETFSTVTTLQNAGIQPIKEVARRLEIQLAKLGEIMIQYIQNYASPNELLMFLDQETGMIRPTQFEGKDVVLNQPVVENGVIKEIKNNTKLGTYSLKVLTRPNLGTERLAKGQMIQQMVMNGQIPPLPAVLVKMFDLLEVDKVEGIIQAIADDMDWKAKYEELANNFKVLQEHFNLSQEEVRRLNNKVSKAQFQSELARVAGEYKGKSQVEFVKLQSRIAALTRELEALKSLNPDVLPLNGDNQ